ncbi:chaperonin 10-like protein [Xylogone sp. PMI_703]|nr:chaperonin 10-like protein [Xylogone sp. PMI_703]
MGDSNFISVGERTSTSTATNRLRSISKHIEGHGTGSRSTKMATPYKFQGWMGLDKDSIKGKMVWQEFEPKTWTEDDVDIKVTHCGICGSDIHTLRSGWGPVHYPCCVGHEIVGVAVKVGKNVKNVKVGDRCGVGAQQYACMRPDCEDCSAGQPNYCQKPIFTYNSRYPDGSRSYGGYSDYHRSPSAFVIKIPDGISSAEAAPMLCGGTTVWNPLVKNGAGPGKRVGIIGIGGLGHFGVLFAKHLGCDKVVAISRSSSKKEDALRLGATDFIATDEDPGWDKKHARSLDLIVSTVSGTDMPLDKYLKLLCRYGQFLQVGLPEDKIPSFSAFALVSKGVKIGGSHIGSPAEISEMLEFAAKNGVHPQIEERPMKEANQAIVDMDQRKARYRYVLVHEDNIKELESTA